MKQRAPEEDQRGRGEVEKRLKTCRLNTRRMLWIIVDEVDKGCLLIRMGVSG